MENRFFPKFNLYDQFGYLFVGGIGLLVIVFNFYLLNATNLIPVFTTQNFLSWLVVTYFLGHIVQAIANTFIKESKTDFSDSEKEILEKAKKYFEVEKQSWNKVYLLCYMLSSAKDITGQVQSFNAYYSLYRGWFVVFSLNSAFVLIFNIINWFSVSYFSLLILSLLFAWLCFKRSKRFYAYSRAKTLQTFIILSRDKL